LKRQKQKQKQQQQQQTTPTTTTTTTTTKQQQQNNNNKQTSVSIGSLPNGMVALVLLKASPRKNETFSVLMSTRTVTNAEGFRRAEATLRVRKKKNKKNKETKRKVPRKDGEKREAILVEGRREHKPRELKPNE
jgi:hypothetical protein